MDPTPRDLLHSLPTHSMGLSRWRRVRGHAVDTKSALWRDDFTRGPKRLSFCGLPVVARSGQASPTAEVKQSCSFRLPRTTRTPLQPPLAEYP